MIEAAKFAQQFAVNRPSGVSMKIP
jgi:hypothetical protein